MEVSLQVMMADYLRGIAAWRRQKAEEYDRDERNLQCAAGLEALAEYVLGLPDDDARIMRLSELAVVGSMFQLQQRAHFAVSRFRFHTPETSCTAFLDHIVELQLADISEAGQFGGRLPEGDDPWANRNYRFLMN
jgi:hypothetical protein